MPGEQYRFCIRTVAPTPLTWAWVMYVSVCVCALFIFCHRMLRNQSVSDRQDYLFMYDDNNSSSGQKRVKWVWKNSRKYMHFDDSRRGRAAIKLIVMNVMAVGVFLHAEQFVFLLLHLDRNRFRSDISHHFHQALAQCKWYLVNGVTAYKQQKHMTMIARNLFVLHILFYMVRGRYALKICWWKLWSGNERAIWVYAERSSLCVQCRQTVGHCIGKFK